MEQSISSLAFKGSIIEAITEAKRQKKLFVVYISGENPDSALLNTSTWTDPTVAESLSKYCILLHILEGSIDAAQFSALFPQKPAPCITAIGYNGIQLWQNEGFVSAEVLASTLEKTWLSLHIQETTATFLTAALASRESEQSASLELGSSSTSDAPSSSSNRHFNTSEVKTNEDLEPQKAEHCENPVEELVSKQDDEVSPEPVPASKLGGGNTEQPSSIPEPVPASKLVGGNTEQPSSTTETVRELINPVELKLIDSGVGYKSSSNEGESSSPEVNTDTSNRHVGISVEAPRVIKDEASESAKLKNAKTLQVERVDTLDASENKSDDIQLNIRLPDGGSLQEKFSPANTLRNVKDYVDEKQESSIGSYDLAIPYPRKVFKDEDLVQTLSELGLLNRQALIVVPHRGAAGHNKGGSLLPGRTTSTNGIGSSNVSSEGYFPFVRRMLSYINPFSYLGAAASSSDSGQESHNNTRQYGANSTTQSNSAGSRRSNLVSPNQNTPPSGRTVPSRQQTSSRFGSNIHTLRHDEDDSKFTDRNSFWNGNSTEYGGDNSNSK